MEVEFESYLNKRATGFYESSYLDEVSSLASTICHILSSTSNITVTLPFRMESDTTWQQPNFSIQVVEKLFQVLMIPD